MVFESSVPWFPLKYNMYKPPSHETPMNKEKKRKGNTRRKSPADSPTASDLVYHSAAGLRRGLTELHNPHSHLR
jgi:hypothetical protein